MLAHIFNVQFKINKRWKLEHSTESGDGWSNSEDDLINANMDFSVAFLAPKQQQHLH